MKMFDFIKRYFKNRKDKIYADCFISLGGACRPAHYLREFNLRTFSSPFDWMMSYKLSDVTHLIKSGGADFFAKFVELERSEKDYPHHRFVQDSQTKMISMHDFPRQQSVEEHYGEFMAKYQRRFEALKKAILGAKHIVFVANRNENKANFVEFLRQMREFHAISYTFINVRHDEKAEKLKKTIKIVNGGGGFAN